MLFIDDDSKRITDYDNPGIFFAIDRVHRRGRAIRRRLVACIFTVYLLLLYWSGPPRGTWSSPSNTAVFP